MYSGETIAAYAALALSILALGVVALMRLEQRLTQIVAQETASLNRDMAALQAEVRALTAALQAHAAAPSPVPVATPASLAPAQLGDICHELREMRRELAVWGGPKAPHYPAPTPHQASAPVPMPASSPTPAPERQPVPARLLDAVLTDNLGPCLTHLQQRGGQAPNELDVPGDGQAVAKLLSLHLARADEQGVYLTETGRDIANLLLSVGR